MSGTPVSKEREISAVIERIVSDPRNVHTVDALDPERRENINDRRSDRELKRKYAFWFIWILIGQLVAMNTVFILYGLDKLKFTDYILHLYMGGTLLEIFGVVLVITRSLFPASETAERRRTIEPPKQN